MSWRDAWRSTWRLLLLMESDRRSWLWLDLVLVYVFWVSLVIGIHWVTLELFGPGG